MADSAFRYRACRIGRVRQGWYVDGLKDSNGVTVRVFRDSEGWRIADFDNQQTYPTRNKAAANAAKSYGVQHG